MSADSIGDMLTMIRNANHKLHEKVDIPLSNMKKEIARILKDEGYISDFRVIQDKKQGVLRVFLKYLPNKVRVLQGIQRVSKPSLRKYYGSTHLPRVRGGLGLAIVSTSSGVMADYQAREKKIGGEVVASIW